MVFIPLNISFCCFHQNIFALCAMPMVVFQLFFSCVTKKCSQLFFPWQQEFFLSLSNRKTVLNETGERPLLGINSYHFTTFISKKYLHTYNFYTIINLILSERDNINCLFVLVLKYTLGVIHADAETNISSFKNRPNMTAHASMSYF